MNEKAAELIGAHVGDGTLYFSGKSVVWELRGSIYEQEYYSHMAALIKNLLSTEVKPKYRGSNSYGIQTTNKIIIDFLTKNGFSQGSKVYTVRIPSQIKNSEKKIKAGFIRGLFDTDGCVYFGKNRTPYHYYPRVEFGFASEDLVLDLSQLLKELGFRIYCWKNDECSYVGLAGFANLDKWLALIKPSNKKHLVRIGEGLANKDKVNLKNKSKSLKSSLS